MPANWNSLPGTGASLQNVAAVVNNSLSTQTEAINAQIITLQEQIRQSEQNLSAQHNVSKCNWLVLFWLTDLILNSKLIGIVLKVLTQQQQNQIDEAIEKAQNENVIKQAEEQTIRLNEFDAILQPIIDSCTKDSISAGMHCCM